MGSEGGHLTTGVPWAAGGAGGWVARACLLFFLLPSHVQPMAEPKSFTEDPYVDDEKFREKGDFLIPYKICFFNLPGSATVHLRKSFSVNAL